MVRFLSCRLLAIVLAGGSLAGGSLAGRAEAQVTPSQNVVPSPGTTSLSNDAIQPVPVQPSVQPLADDSEPWLDPASLLPDLPSLPPAKASRIGGTIEKLIGCATRLPCRSSAAAR